MKPIIAYLGLGKCKCNTSVGKYMIIEYLGALGCCGKMRGLGRSCGVFSVQRFRNPHDVPQPLECGILGAKDE